MKNNTFKATSAEEVTKICYSEETRNLNYRIQCEDIEDFKNCISIIDSYNEFDAERINKAVDKYLSFKTRYGENNPNNDRNAFTFDIGRESSPVMYIKYYDFGSHLINPFGKEEGNRPEAFKNALKEFASVIGSDEFSIDEDSSFFEARIWFD